MLIVPYIDAKVVDRIRDCAIDRYITRLCTVEQAWLYALQVYLNNLYKVEGDM